MARILAVVLALTASGAAWAGSDENHLVLSGAIRASSARVVSTDAGCGYRDGRLEFMSGAMRLGPGKAVVRVVIELSRFHGPGVYSATRPRVQYGFAPVQIRTAKNATTGVGAAWSARRGSVRVVSARNIGKADREGSATGSVNATATYRGKPVRLRGTWRCTIPPTV